MIFDFLAWFFCDRAVLNSPKGISFYRNRYAEGAGKILRNPVVYRTAKKIFNLSCKPCPGTLPLQFTQLKNFETEMTPVWNFAKSDNWINVLKLAHLIFRLVEMLLRTINLLPGVRNRLLIGLWTSFIVFNYSVVQWVDTFANPVFKNPGIYKTLKISNIYKIQKFKAE